MKNCDGLDIIHLMHSVLHMYYTLVTWHVNEKFINYFTPFNAHIHCMLV